jgi:FemAB-related protein (PEP-CTERM system-associated)
VVDTLPGSKDSPPLRVSEWTDRDGWEAFVDSAPDATMMHRWVWRDVIAQAYGHRTFCLAAHSGGRLRGVLPLTLVAGRMLGRQLVSMPFLDYGGVCVAGDRDAERELVRAATQMAHAERAVLVLRHAEERRLEIPVSLEKVSMLLDLGDSEEALWRRLPSERRNRVRKGQRHGLVASVGGASSLSAFYDVLATNMRDLGSPVHHRRFFAAVMEHVGEDARIVLVRDEGRPIGAAVMLLHRKTISLPWVSSLRSSLKKSPNQVLYWEAMRWGIGSGYRILDFGRSSKGTGTYEAKRQWGADVVQLYWHYHPESAGPPTEGIKRLAWATRLWRRLPIPVANALGPRIRKAIPN